MNMEVSPSIIISTFLLYTSSLIKVDSMHLSSSVSSILAERPYKNTMSIVIVIIVILKESPTKGLYIFTGKK